MWLHIASCTSLFKHPFSLSHCSESVYHPGCECFLDSSVLTVSHSLQVSGLCMECETVAMEPLSQGPFFWDPLVDTRFFFFENFCTWEHMWERGEEKERERGRGSQMMEFGWKKVWKYYLLRQQDEIFEISTVLEIPPQRWDRTSWFRCLSKDLQVEGMESPQQSVLIITLQVIGCTETNILRYTHVWLRHGWMSVQWFHFKQVSKDVCGSVVEHSWGPGAQSSTHHQ